MDKRVQALIAVACIAVIAGVGLIFIRDHEQQAAIEKAAAQASRDDTIRSAAECAPIVSAWDRGDKSIAISKYGNLSDIAIKSCRAIIDIAKHQ